MSEPEPLDFDLFWQDRRDNKPIGHPVKLLGKLWFLNTDIEFRELRQLQHMDVSDFDGMTLFIDKLYGKGAFEHWLESGLTLNQVPIILAWSIAIIQGRNVTFNDVADQVEDLIAGGKVRITYGNTGEPLKPTSNNSTE